MLVYVYVCLPWDWGLNIVYGAETGVLKEVSPGGCWKLFCLFKRLNLWDY